MADFIYLMETRLTPDQQRAVALVTDVARAHEMNIYLTGGAVRDIISGFVIRDLDFSVQGNALKLQKDFEKAGAVLEATDEGTRTLMLLLRETFARKLPVPDQNVMTSRASRPRLLREQFMTTCGGGTLPSTPWRSRLTPDRAGCLPILSTAWPILKPRCCASCITTLFMKSHRG